MKEKIFGVAPAVPVGKLVTGAYDAPVTEGATAQYVCTAGASCGKSNASGLLVKTEPNAGFVEIAVQEVDPVNSTDVINGLKAKGVTPLIKAVGPFVTTGSGGLATQDVAYMNGVSVGTSPSTRGQDGLVITNGKGDVMVTNKRDIRLGDFENLGVPVPAEQTETRISVTGTEEEKAQFAAIMKDNKLSAFSNLLIVDNGVSTLPSTGLKSSVNDPYRSRRFLVVMPDGSTGILSTVEHARMVDFAKVAEASGAKYAVNLDTGFYDEATMYLADGTPRHIGEAGADSNAHGIVVIGTRPVEGGTVQRTDLITPEQTVPATETITGQPVPNVPDNAPKPVETLGVKGRRPEGEEQAPQTITQVDSAPLPPPYVAAQQPVPAKLPTFANDNVTGGLDTRTWSRVSVNESPATAAPRPDNLPTVVETPGTVPAPETTQAPRPNTSPSDFAVTETMPDGSIRTLRPDVTTPGSNVPSINGGGRGGGIVPPPDNTWRAYKDEPLPGPWLGKTGGLPWWTIGGIGGIAATLTGIAILTDDKKDETVPPTETAAAQPAPKPERSDKLEPCKLRAITRDNMLRMLLGDPLSEVDCVPTPANILNNEPLPRIPDLPPVVKPGTGPGTVAPGTVTPKPTVAPGTGPGTGGSAPTGSSGAPTGGTNAGNKSGTSNSIMAFLSGFLKGLVGAMQQRAAQPQPIPPVTNPPVIPNPNGTSTPITVQITADPNPAHDGDSVRISWASVSAAICRAYTETGSQIATGTPDTAVLLTAPGATSRYYVSCRNAAGQVATGSVQLIVR